jgi:hypothetical protein
MAINGASEIDQLRETIHALQGERKVIMQQKLSRAEVKAALKNRIKHAADEGAKELQLAMLLCASGGFVNPLQVTAKGYSDPQDTVFANANLAPLLVALLGVDVIESALSKHLDAAVPVGLEPKARTKRLAEIEVELDRAERAEEALIVQAEALGKAVYRRGDARPEIVLAVLDA